jgi:hypothetical protein
MPLPDKLGLASLPFPSATWERGEKRRRAMPALQEKADMNISELLQQKRRQVLEIAAGHGARNVRLFGSVARGEATATSDLDLLIEMAPERTLLDIVAIKQDLEELLGCKVDVVTEAAISPYLRDKVLHEAVRL